MTVPPDSGPALEPPIVSPEGLAEHYDEVVVADVRWYLDGRSGYDAYLNQRLPGAVFVDLDQCLSRAVSRGGPPSAPHPGRLRLGHEFAGHIQWGQGGRLRR